MLSAKYQTLKIGATLNLIYNILYLLSALYVLIVGSLFIGKVEAGTGQMITSEYIYSVLILMSPIIFVAIVTFIISIIILSFIKSQKRKTAVTVLSIIVFIFNVIALVYSITFYLQIFVIICSVVCCILFIVGLSLPNATKYYNQTQNIKQITQESKSPVEIQIENIKSLYKSGIITEQEYKTLLSKVVFKVNNNVEEIKKAKTKLTPSKEATKIVKNTKIKDEKKIQLDKARETKREQIANFFKNTNDIDEVK